MLSKLRHAMFLRRYPIVCSPTKRVFSSKISDGIDAQIVNELNQVPHALSLSVILVLCVSVL